MRIGILIKELKRIMANCEDVEVYDCYEGEKVANSKLFTGVIQDIPSTYDTAIVTYMASEIKVIRDKNGNSYDDEYKPITVIYILKEDWVYVSAHTFEKAKEKAIKENPTCYVKVVKEIKMS